VNLIDKLAKHRYTFGISSVVCAFLEKINHWKVFFD
jgi:hypothetical protein